VDLYDLKMGSATSAAQEVKKLSVEVVKKVAEVKVTITGVVAETKKSHIKKASKKCQFTDILNFSGFCTPQSCKMFAKLASGERDSVPSACYTEKMMSAIGEAQIENMCAKGLNTARDT
jgi:hypothetical protein